MGISLNWGAALTKKAFSGESFRLARRHSRPIDDAILFSAPNRELAVLQLAHPWDAFGHRACPIMPAIRG